MKPQCVCGCLEPVTEYPDCSKDPAKIRLRYEKERFRSRDSSRQQDYEWRAYCWEKHRKRVSDAKSVINTRSPNYTPLIFTHHNTKYNRRLANFARIERENVILTQNIKKELVGDSRMDNHNHLFSICKRNRGFRRLTQQLQLAYQNMKIAHRLDKISATPTYIKCNQLNWYTAQEHWMELKAKFPLYWRDVICKSYEVAALAKAFDGTKPLVYFDLEVKDSEIGRVVIELDPIASPVATEMFRLMFEGKYKNYNYKCAKLNKLWPGIGWSFAPGLKSIVKCPFPPKKYRMKHDQMGIVSLVNNGQNLFQAEFVITARELKPLDDKNLAIGFVTQGMTFLDSLSKYLFKDKASFRKPMYIVKTGLFEPSNPPPAPEMTRKCPSDSKTPDSLTTQEIGEEEVGTESELFDFDPMDDEPGFKQF
ncbi:unnamed protein product [Allacma fusca]|uniref:PPIase cyclophilin-type domain-containing protein n=1 Tax=Allacma fusca TaxID=39272 RepID=A0A8J2PRT5_9HEXA|nr:unnamed protein product [Allacma fusca]